MHDLAQQEEQLPGTEHVAFTLGRDIDGSFDALDRDLSSHAVRRQRMACAKDEAHDFEVLGLEQRHCLFASQSLAKRLDIDGLVRKGVRNGHGLQSMRLRTPSRPRRGD